MIKNLALKGGGVKGVAYVGAIKELDKANLYNGIERVSGTSAGALMSCNEINFEVLFINITFTIP